MRFHGLFTLLACVLVQMSPVFAADPVAVGAPVLTTQGQRFLLDGRTIDLWGIRVGSATRDDKTCDHLIAQLDDYKAHGVNAVTVFYAGCSVANYDPFTPDGKTIDAGHRQRMERIAAECARRQMILVAGIFYQRAPFGLQNADAVRHAVRAVTEHLKPYRNVIINIANEQNSGGWQKQAKVFDFRKPENIGELCRIVHEEDPKRLVGGGGYDHGLNEQIGRIKDVDVLLFDTAGPNLDSGTLYKRFIAAGVKNKPMVNVETFGAWTKKFAKGVFPEEARRAYQREINAAAAEPGLGLFFHNNPWCQSDDGNLRYDLGGSGTESDPGIRWYFEAVKAAAGK